MNFQYSAFIENSSEMREWLQKLGYINLCKCKDKYLLTYDDSNEVGSCDLDFILRAIEEGRKIVDCRSNPNKFKAVSAMREDSDFMQLFTQGKGLALYEWVLCEDEIFRGRRAHTDTIDGKMIFSYVNKECYHKARLSEIEERYKDYLSKNK